MSSPDILLRLLDAGVVATINAGGPNSTKTYAFLEDWRRRGLQTVASMPERTMQIGAIAIDLLPQLRREAEAAGLVAAFPCRKEGAK